MAERAIQSHGVDVKQETIKKKKAPFKKKSEEKNECLGPIADLENHLPGDWWRYLFNSIYLKTDADVVENDENTNEEVDLILKYGGILPGDRILDVCCGQGRHSLELAARGFPNIVGVDRSRYLIRLAKKRAAIRGFKTVQFREGDARKIRFSSQMFDLVILMGNSFGYFEREEENLQVLKETFRLLNDGSTILLDLSDGEWMKANFVPRSWEWIDQNTLVCRERNLAKDGFRLITREVVIDAKKGVITDQFYAERLYAREELKALLIEAGFHDVQIHNNIQAKSTRSCNDLGMMANRIFMTAKVMHPMPDPLSLLNKRKKTQIQCTVLMGDPSLPDLVKVNGQFNAEDFDTIKKLKEALSSLDEFHFNFQNEHKKMVKSLIQHPPAFVFNLCDEGYYNDPLKELHVPALLEMLDVPYTGAGPGCLGLCYNKGLVGAWAQDMGIPVPQEIWIDSENFSAAIPSEFPAFVKPVFGDSSIGITKNAIVHSSSELLDYCNWVKSTLPNVPLLIQEFLSGAEYSLGVIGNGSNLIFLPVLEVDYSGLPSDCPHLLGYESKWLPDSPYWNKIKYKKASLSEEEIGDLYDKSSLLFHRLGCRDYARLDFRKDANGVMKLLEVNPNPGWCWDGKLNLMAQWMGWSYSDLLRQILQATRERLGI